MVIQETSELFRAILLGIALGVIYDFFRFARMLVKSPVPIVFFEDVAYFLIAAFLSFSFMLETTDGQVRFFILFGEAVGCIGYLLTVGRLTKRILELVSGMIKSVFKVISTPFLLLKKAAAGFSKKKQEKI